MVRGYFKTVPKEQMSDIARLGGLTRQSPKLKLAWSHQFALKKRYDNGERIKDLAAEYEVTARSMNRIVREK